MALLGSVPLLYRKLIVSLVLVVLIGLVLEWYFSTKNGLLLRAVGDNDTLVTTLAVDKGSMKILGLVIANALVALSGCIVCQEGRSLQRDDGHRTNGIRFGGGHHRYHAVPPHELCEGDGRRGHRQHPV